MKIVRGKVMQGDNEHEIQICIDETNFEVTNVLLDGKTIFSGDTENFKTMFKEFIEIVDELEQA